jgi:branched-chain amino acid transport system substrate-binding protein
MLFVEVKIRRFPGAVSGALFTLSALLAGAFVPTSAAAHTGEPIKIGYSMALTGGLAPNGRSALLAQKIWEEDTNAKGGLLGRPVKLIYYDDVNPACASTASRHDRSTIISAISTACWACNADRMRQRKKLTHAFGNAVNSAFNYAN